MKIYYNLHSNMDRLKLHCRRQSPAGLDYLHSNMDRLKPDAAAGVCLSSPYLHSNMDRLKQYPERANIPNNNSSFY